MRSLRPSASSLDNLQGRFLGSSGKRLNRFKIGRFSGGQILVQLSRLRTSSGNSPGARQLRASARLGALPRAPQGTAPTGDPRNLGGLLIIALVNRFLDRLAHSTGPMAENDELHRP